MAEEVISLNMPVTVYGQLERYNDVISKARCRIFYKYGNRNGTYITDEFAEKLLSTISYAPVKGIYDNFDEDYTDHGAKRSLGRIYGIVPENPNVAWEKHLDEDGVEREYACVDVLIFTGLYEEAEQIVGKAQSMEIYDQSISGEWQFIDGKRYYVFADGCFLGLQVLGDEVEPCFEGASFYTLLEPIQRLIKDYKNFEANFQKQGGYEMPQFNFKLSDDEKFMALWSLLNPDFNEEGNWTVSYSICNVYDDYAVVRNNSENVFERVYYSKDDSTDSVIIGDKVRCYIIDVTSEEKIALETLQKLNGGTYEKVDETYSKVAELEENNANYEQKIEELNGSLATLTLEKDQLVVSLETSNNSLNETAEALESVNNSFAQAQDAIAALTNERDELASFKATVEKEEKKAIISSYSDKLSEEIISKFTTEIDNYNAQDLKKELAYELVESNPAVFSKNPQVGFVPKDNPKGGIEEILSKYRK